MLHKRIAINLRDHFSTVGPSPIHSAPTSSLSGSASSSIASAQQESRPQTAAARLHLLSPASPVHNPDDAGNRHRSIPVLSDVIATAAQRFSSFFAEAAVLVLVLGILDRFLASNRIELRWISCAFLIALGLLAASIATDVSARRWLRAH
jgi:hypothetical protein